jgi:hypothetical protein
MGIQLGMIGLEARDSYQIFLDPRMPPRIPVWPRRSPSAVESERLGPGRAVTAKVTAH